MTVAAALAISLTGCGQGASSSASSAASPPAGSALTVTPASGGPSTTFTARFVPPASTASAAGSKLGFTLGLTAPGRSGCIGARSLQVPPTGKGDPIYIALDPARLGGRWCEGTYTARVLEVQTPVCAAGTMCPQYVRVVGTVGTARFRVSRSS